MRQSKHFNLFIVLFIILMFPSVCFSKSLENSFSSIRTPQQLADWLSSEFVFRWEMQDDWQTPQETLHSKGGDCIDFALLSSAVLKHIEIPNDVVIIEFGKLRIKHAVCIWKKKSGFYSFISNQKLVHTKKRTIEEAIEKFYPDWTKITFASLANGQRKYIKVIGKKNGRLYKQNTFLCRRNKSLEINAPYSPFGNSL